MLRKIFFLFCIFFSCFSYVFGEDQEYVLQYTSCKEIIESPYIADLNALRESKCITLSQENNPAVILLSQKQEVLATQTIQQEILDTLKTKYYRAEQLKVVFSGELKDISSAKIQIKVQEKNYAKIMTPTGDYNIEIKSDVSFLEKKVLAKYCRADSFILECDTGFYRDIQDRIDTLFQDMLLRGENLFEKDEVFLEKEQEKIQKIRTLYQALSLEYKNSQKILYLLESIDYKLSIYESIIKNILAEKKLKKILSLKQEKMKGNYYAKLGEDIYIFTEKLYIYFYKGNTLVNTIQNDLSHFSPDEIQKFGLSLDDRSGVAYHLIQKYSVIAEKNIPKNYRLIEKKWFEGPTYILLSDQGHRFTLESIPSFIQIQGEKIFFILKKKNGNIVLTHTVGKNSLSEFYNLDTSMYQEITGYSFVGKNIEISLKRYDQSSQKKYISF